LNYIDMDGKTPLLRACELNSYEASKLLIDAGADVNKSGIPETPLHFAILNNNLALLNALISKKDINVDCINSNDETPLITAVKIVNLEFVKILIAHKANPLVVTKKKQTLLHLACIHAPNVDMISWILANTKIDVNAVDSKQRTALHYCINNSTSISDASFEKEQCLFKKGAKINIVDNKGRTPLHYAFCKMQNINLNLSTAIDPIETVSSLCAIDGININIKDKFKKTALHYAAMRSSVMCSIHLLQKGATLEVQDEDNNTPLATALVYGHPEYAILLMQKDANINALVQNISYETIELSPLQQDKEKKEKKGKKLR